MSCRRQNGCRYAHLYAMNSDIHQTTVYARTPEYRMEY